MTILTDTYDRMADLVKRLAWCMNDNGTVHIAGIHSLAAEAVLIAKELPNDDRDEAKRLLDDYDIDGSDENLIDAVVSAIRFGRTQAKE